MRAEIYDRLVRVTLSERNLLTLLYRLRQQGGTKGLQSGDVHIKGMAVAGFKLQLAAEPDAAHYGDREPGELDLAVEGFIEEESVAANADRHPVGALIDLNLGYCGRMISGSKSGFRSAYPDHVPIFNANVFILEDGKPVKVWHGDLDLTVDESRLVQIAIVCEQALTVLHENDGRFWGRDREPLLDDIPLRIEPDGSTEFDERSYRRGEDGSLRIPVRSAEDDDDAAEGSA